MALVVMLGLGWTRAVDSSAKKRGEARQQAFEQRKTLERTKTDQTEIKSSDEDAVLVQELQEMRLKFMSHANDKMFQMSVGPDILEKAAKCPEKSMPDDLRAFIHQLKSRMIID